VREVSKIILHYTETDMKGQTAALITDWHKKRGFSTIGYHYFIRRNGRVEVGRKESDVGAHCKGYNSESIGICLAGKNIFTKAQFAALKQLLADLKKRYPNATLHGHREFNPFKECPGFDYSAFVERWNEEDTWSSFLNILKIFLRMLRRR